MTTRHLEVTPPPPSNPFGDVPRAGCAGAEVIARVAALETSIARIEASVRNLGRKATFAAFVGASIADAAIELWGSFQ